MLLFHCSCNAILRLQERLKQGDEVLEMIWQACAKGSELEGLFRMRLESISRAVGNLQHLQSPYAVADSQYLTLLLHQYLEQHFAKPGFFQIYLLSTLHRTCSLPLIIKESTNGPACTGADTAQGVLCYFSPVHLNSENCPEFGNNQIGTGLSGQPACTEACALH